MAVQRSRRLRKKLHIDEFQEIGFGVNWRFAEGTSIDEVDRLVNLFIEEVIVPQGLFFEGSGYLAWEGLVGLQKIGKCTEQHQESVKQWLESHQMQDVVISEMFDIWWD